MGLKIGIVGLPNVGKSTLFNALTGQKAAAAANYPFCTIDPNFGVIAVPDRRLDELAVLVQPEKTVPAVVEFVDIAGLVKGASNNEGMGNAFLAHIRECNAIAQLIRAFADNDIIHVHDTVDPRRDREIIESELLLADLQTAQNRLDKAKSQSKSGDKEKAREAQIMEALVNHLAAGNHARDFVRDEQSEQLVRGLHLLTDKPILYLVNVAERELATFDEQEVKERLDLPAEAAVIPISARLEEELIDFGREEAAKYLAELGLKESSLNQVIRRAYEILGLQTYFTAGKKEVRAWTITRGSKAPEAAGVIHTDFEKGFIKAEVIPYAAIIAHGGQQQAREKGLMRLEGKEYVVQEGDVMLFKFNV